MKDLSTKRYIVATVAFFAFAIGLVWVQQGSGISLAWTGVAITAAVFGIRLVAYLVRRRTRLGR
jgi:hypothetical protein